jgi:hypothetical protein
VKQKPDSTGSAGPPRRVCRRLQRTHAPAQKDRLSASVISQTQKRAQSLPAGLVTGQSRHMIGSYLHVSYLG